MEEKKDSLIAAKFITWGAITVLIIWGGYGTYTEHIGYKDGLHEHDTLKYTYYLDIQGSSTYATGYISGYRDYIGNTLVEKDKKAAGL